MPRIFATLLLSILSLSVFSGQARAESTDYPLEQNKRLVERLFYEGFSGGDLRVVEEIFSPDIKFVDPNLPAGIEGIKAIVLKNNQTFTDWHFTLHELMAVENKVIARWTGSGIHANSFMDESPTGQRVSLNGISIYEIVDGRIISDWVIPDNLQFLIQLGVLAPLSIVEDAGEH